MATRRRASTVASSTTTNAADYVLDSKTPFVANGDVVRRGGRRRLQQMIDRFILRAQGGHGGNGCNAFECVGSAQKKRPNGGNGGKGGDAVLVASSRLHSLAFPSHVVKGTKGRNGLGKGLHGTRGDDRVLAVPVGTCVSSVTRCEETGKLVAHEMLCDLREEGQAFVAAKGGVAGLGNGRFGKLDIHRRRLRGRDALRTPSEGNPGEVRTLELRLRLLADVGLVGFPNAGKSTLLGALSSAKPRTAHFAFTTMEPFVGHVKYADEHSISVADMPGLVEGAHHDRGLGHRFLQHAELTAATLLVVDASRLSLGADVATLQAELAAYSTALAARPTIVVANKCESPATLVHVAAAREEPALCGVDVIAVSALHGRNLDVLAAALRRLVTEAAVEAVAEEEEDEGTWAARLDADDTGAEREV
jgi:GTP-binding protein